MMWIVFFLHTHDQVQGNIAVASNVSLSMFTDYYVQLSAKTDITKKNNTEVNTLCPCLIVS